MRAISYLSLTILLASCASPPPVPDTVPKRYREFIQRSDLPFAQRVSLYLGLSTTTSPSTHPPGEAIVIRSSRPNAISAATIRFDAFADNVYTGQIWTDFDPLITCISTAQLERVGHYLPGQPIAVHGHGPGNSFGVVRLDPTPDHFFFVLDSGIRVDALAVMENGCLVQLKHPVSLGQR